jgi:predicted RNA polymerase sigma factor
MLVCDDMENMNGQAQQAQATNRAIEQTVRDSYGRLLAFLVVRSRDVAGAEDALADAFKTALETWPRTGVPEKPEA